jgi:hypothetical protein
MMTLLLSAALAAPLSDFAFSPYVGEQVVLLDEGGQETVGTLLVLEETYVVVVQSDGETLSLEREGIVALRPIEVAAEPLEPESVVAGAPADVPSPRSAPLEPSSTQWSLSATYVRDAGEHLGGGTSGLGLTLTQGRTHLYSRVQLLVRSGPDAGALEAYETYGVASDGRWLTPEGELVLAYRPVAPLRAGGLLYASNDWDAFDSGITWNYTGSAALGPYVGVFMPAVRGLELGLVVKGRKVLHQFNLDPEYVDDVTSYYGNGTYRPWQSAWSTTVVGVEAHWSHGPVLVSGELQRHRHWPSRNSSAEASSYAEVEVLLSAGVRF